jgi:hypothetical protein
MCRPTWRSRLPIEVYVSTLSVFARRPAFSPALPPATPPVAVAREAPAPFGLPCISALARRARAKSRKGGANFTQKEICRTDYHGTASGTIYSVAEVQRPGHQTASTRLPATLRPVIAVTQIAFAQKGQADAVGDVPTGQQNLPVASICRRAWHLCLLAVLPPITRLDRDRGTPHGATPPTPPGIRVTYLGGSIELCRDGNIKSGEAD